MNGERTCPRGSIAPGGWLAGPGGAGAAGGAVVMLPVDRPQKKTALLLLADYAHACSIYVRCSN